MTQASAWSDPDDALHAYLDGELSPDEAAEVEARLLADPRALARFAAYGEQRDLIHAAARAPTSGVTNLRTEALQRELAGRLRQVASASRAAHAPAWGPFAAPMRTAATVLLLVGSAAGGWLAHVHLGGGSEALPDYVSEAVGAHLVFATDETRPVEFPAEASPEALAWASAKLGRTLSIPDLEPLGIHLVGTRLLGTKEGPLAQFLYEDGPGHRLSVTIAPHPADQPVADLQLASVAGLTGGVVGYWREAELDYALVAETDGTRIEAIASQLDGSATF